MPAAADQTLKLTTPIEALSGVSPKLAPALRALGIKALAHLLNHLPHRHEQLEAETEVAELVPGRIISTRGEVTATRVVARGARPRFEAVLLDHTGRLDLVWFNQTFLHNTIHPGTRLRVQGKLTRRNASLQLVNPKTEVLKDWRPEPGQQGARIRPVYPASEEAPSAIIEKLVQAHLDAGTALIEDHLTEAFCAARSLPRLADAYRAMHRPESMEAASAARRRLAYDELLLLQLGVCMRREYLRRRRSAPALKWNQQIDRHIRARLPFTLTPWQETVIKEVAGDLTRASPANRLIQGDVGSGKTAVALYAMLLAVATKHQAALMAPTELLAEQHFASISRTLSGSDVRVELLTGSLGAGERRAALARVEKGDAHLVIGTHALISGGVRFKSLAVAVIDEQHRFGVHQRAALREKADGAASPHTLVMTATPIPRTLSLTIFGDLDVSTLEGLPPGRKPVKTRLVAPDKSADVYGFVRKKLQAGEQAFVVVPAVGGDAEDQGEDAARRVADVHTTLARLSEGPLKGLRLAAIHGQLPRAERERIMERFRAGEIDALVATTVIEVGVDVPNATVMVIEQAERFGLAQLHQLRGRVGRGTRGGVCALIADESGPQAETRLKAVAGTTDGFRLAEVDFSLRGPGDIFGGRQSGIAPFRVAEFPRDSDLLLMARRDAGAWIAGSPELGLPQERLVRSRLMKAYGKSLGLGDVA